VTLDGRYPVALLPVRLETRFAGSLLKVRIFPDEIFADTHEPELTPEERTDGSTYMQAVKTGPAAERNAWAQLAGRWTAPRAAFIASAAASGATASRAQSWTRPALATLPDHWLVRAYQGPFTYTVTSSPVQKPLALTLSPASTPADRVTISDALAIDKAVRWTVDFATAEAAGMAVTVDLTKPDQPPAAPPDPSAGVDLLLVVGVSDSATPAAGAAQLRALVDAHHYTRGLAFLRPGTPTNNTPDVPAAFPPADPGGSASFAIERAAPLVSASSAPGANGLLFAPALGLPLAAGEQVAAVEHIEGAGIDGDSAAAAMNDALWPATLGYCMEQMLAPTFSESDIAAARAHWANHVRPGGPLPAFRVGGVPYGLLPAVALDRLPADRQVSALRQLRDGHFLPAAADAPHITAASPDPDAELLEVLAQDASSHHARIRVLLGQEVTVNTSSWLGPSVAAAEQGRLNARTATAAALLGTFGLGGQTRLGGLDASSYDELVGQPFVAPGPLSEDVGLAGADGSGVNYIAWLHDNAFANIDAIRTDALPSPTRPLLYRLLRHALLTEMDRFAFTQLAGANVVPSADRIEPELVKLTTADPRLTSYERIARVVETPGLKAALAPYLARLQILATLPTAELDRRFGESLDACAHRLDAWITAVATERLWTLRQASPTGCHLGGYGWVEDARPAAAAASPGGFIHAASAAQASAAAVLRNGYLSRGGTGSAYDVDLGSARVRDALVLLDGTRQGEPLAALLGQRFERDLHQRQLEPLIAPLRAHFPLVAGKTPDGDGPTEFVAAGNVVDGLALRSAWNDKSAPFSGASDLPALTPAQLDSFHAALDALDDTIDGVADLLTAESVFQAVRGNTTAAAASLDAMAQGVLPPRPEVARSPLAGVSFTQRLVVALDGSTTPAPGAWGARTPRAAAEPFLDNWVATLLGPPAKIGCQVRFPDGSVHPVALNTLALRPLDLVALARTPPPATGDGELDRRVLQAANAPAGSRVVYDAAGAPVTLAAALELARTIGELLARARPLSPSDLVVPAAGRATPASDQAAKAAARAQAALNGLGAAAGALDTALAPVAATPAPTAAQLTALRTALRSAAAFGVEAAYAPDAAEAPDLLTLAQGVQKELATRRAGAPPLTATDPTALLAAAADTMNTVFGADFLFLPALTAPALQAPLAASPTLVGDANLPRQMLQQVARVRPAVGRWRSLWLYAQALGAAAPTLEVAQLPAAPAWAGRPGVAIPSGTLSLVVHRPTAAAPQTGWAGFVVDEWVETVPAAVQHTSLSFRYQAPVAEAPQAVLLAVPPTDDATWDPEAIVDTVRDTLALAKLRAVDGSQLDRLRPFLPAIFLTGNTANEAVSTNLLGSLLHDPVLGET
jgi:hypothetical protein